MSAARKVPAGPLPGPWSAASEPDPLGKRYVIHSIPTATGVAHCWTKGDADLIAAAPDLLACALAADEALSNACDPVKDSNNPLEALRWNLRESIKKATEP